MAEITAAIEGLTRRLHAYRVFENFKKGNLDMPLEIRGLRGKALKARANIDALNAAYDAFNEKAPAHAADVAGLTEQVTGMGEDLEFAVNVLGNSVGESEKLAKGSPEEVARWNAEREKLPPAPPPAAQGAVAASQEVGQFAASTFQEQGKL